MRTRLFSLTLVLAGVLLAGCGGGGTGDGATGDGATSGTRPDYPATGGPTVSDPPTFDNPPGSGKPTPNLTITGTPTEGVENGCVVMESGGTLYLLLGGDRTALMSGGPVRVRGVPRPGLMTTCQQGTPFQVTEVTPA